MNLLELFISTVKSIGKPLVEEASRGGLVDLAECTLMFVVFLVATVRLIRFSRKFDADRPEDDYPSGHAPWDVIAFVASVVTAIISIAAFSGIFDSLDTFLNPVTHVMEKFL